MARTKTAGSRSAGGAVGVSLSAVVRPERSRLQPTTIAYGRLFTCTIQIAIAAADIQQRALEKHDRNQERIFQQQLLEKIR